MSILSELTAGSTTGCKLCAYLDTIPAQDRVEWDEALALPVQKVNHTTVVAVLRRRGVTLSEASVRRHRRNHDSL